jgi:hypothetical protein
MRLQQARDYLPTIASFCSTLGFTGGEPFLHYRDIAVLIRDAKTLGLKTHIVTGAGWVKKEAQTRTRIELLVEAGLDGLNISWDQYHEAFSKPEQAVMLARIAAEAGLDVIVRAVVSATRTKEEESARFTGLPVDLMATRIVRLGRAASLSASHFTVHDKPPAENCDVVLSPVIEPDGSVYACCGPAKYGGRPSPLLLGDAKTEPLDDILARGLKDPVLDIIYNLGPYGLLQLLKDHPVGRERFKARSAYTGICELCLDITGDPALVSALRERLKDKDVQRLVAASHLWRENTNGVARDAVPTRQRHNTRLASPPVDADKGRESVGATMSSSDGASVVEADLCRRPL